MLEFNSRSVDGLYAEALVLQNETRHAFAEGVADCDEAVLTHYKEATFERITGAVTWLRSQKDYFEGGSSLFMLRLARRLPTAAEFSSNEELSLLPAEMRELVETVARFHVRLGSIERQWRNNERPIANALERVRRRLAR